MSDGPSLQDLLLHVTNEIEAAAAARVAAGKQPLMRASSASVELNVVVTSKTEGRGGFDIKVLSLGGTKAAEQQRVHKIVVGLSGLTTVEIRDRTYPERGTMKVDNQSQVDSR